MNCQWTVRRFCVALNLTVRCMQVVPYQVRLVVFAVLLAVANTVGATELSCIGDGSPGLKVATRTPDALVIYEDEPVTVGTGLMGGMMHRNIRVLFDQNYHFSKEKMEIPEQLYPFGPDMAFSSSGGGWTQDFKTWDHSARSYVGYRVNGGAVATFSDVQAEAQRKYNLRPNELLLGVIDGTVFFWRAFEPSSVYWRKSGQSGTYKAALPRRVIDIYGATKGIRKDVGFVVFAKSKGLISYSPYTTEFVELSLSKGVPLHAP